MEPQLAGACLEPAGAPGAGFPSTAMAGRKLLLLVFLLLGALRAQGNQGATGRCDGMTRGCKWYVCVVCRVSGSGEHRSWQGVPEYADVHLQTFT